MTLSFGPPAEGEKKPAGARAQLDATDAEHLRLHGGSIDALLCVGAGSELDLTKMLPFVQYGGKVMLANMQAEGLSLQPRVLQERRLQLHTADAPTQKEVGAMLLLCAQKRVKLLAQEQLEFTPEGAAAALRNLASAPESRAVLVRADQHSKWQRSPCRPVLAFHEH